MTAQQHLTVIFGCRTQHCKNPSAFCDSSGNTENGNRRKSNSSEREMNNMNSIITTRKLDRLVYTTKESAKMLCISQKSVYRLIQRGKLRCISSLRHKRIPRSELERF